jgi:hypothetical protein
MNANQLINKLLEDEEDVVGSTNMPHGHGHPDRKNLDFDRVVRLDYIDDTDVDGQADVQDDANYPLFVTLYDHTKNYGGAEEGGWHYNHYTPIESVQVASYAEAERASMALYDKTGNEDGRPIIVLEKVKGQKEKGAPRYE